MRIRPLAMEARFKAIHVIRFSSCFLRVHYRALALYMARNVANGINSDHSDLRAGSM